MTAVIRYKAPYTVQAHEIFILLFALGHDISLRCVLGLPTLLSIGVAIILLSRENSYTELNRKFPLTLDPPNKCLPDGTTLNKYSPLIQPEVSTNITSTTSLFQYTYSDGTPNPLRKDIPSEKIVVKEHFLITVFPVRFLLFIHIHHIKIFSN